MDSLAPRQGRRPLTDLFSDNVTAWQSINVVCLGCLTHGACVGHWTPDYSAITLPVAHVKVFRVLSSVHHDAISTTCSLCCTQAGPAQAAGRGDGIMMDR